MDLIHEYFIRYKGRQYVPDPYYGDDSDFELAINLLEDACQGIILNFTARGNEMLTTKSE